MSWLLCLLVAWAEPPPGDKADENGPGEPTPPAVGHGPVGIPETPAPARRVAHVKVDGLVGLESDADALRVVRTAGASIERCYEAALRTEPKLEGKAELGLTWLPDGGVEGVSVRVRPTAQPNEAFEACLVRVASRLRFPAREAAVVTQWPMVFTVRTIAAPVP